MKRWALAFVILNLLDMVSTLVVVQSGLGGEVNPLMKVLLDFSPWAFALTKVGICLLVIPFLDPPVTRAGRIAVRSIVILYVLLLIWHAINWVWIFRYMA